MALEELSCTPAHMDGGTQQSKQNLVVLRLYVVDSGSMEFFVTEDFYRKKLQPTYTLRAVNGLEIPYVGYLELQIEIDGVKEPNCRVLVLKDTQPLPNSERTYMDSSEPMFWRRSPSLVPCSNIGLIVSPGRQDPVLVVLLA